jgi:hypothetical protein
MRLHHLAFTFVAAFAALIATSTARANIMIVIDKSAQKMTVTIDGQERYTWSVSTGRGGYDTPTGEFQPFHMERDHFSREWDDAPMPNSIFFTKIGHAIHGTFETRNLGRPVSHGCVRLAPQNAATLFALVKDEGLFNTRVRLTGYAPQSNAPVASRDRSKGNDRLTARTDTSRTNETDTARPRNVVENKDADDAPPQRASQPRAVRYSQYSLRSYYHRERRYYERRSYGRALFFPFGW